MNKALHLTIIMLVVCIKSRRTLAASKVQGSPLPPKPAFENCWKCNIKLSSNSQSDSAQRQISSVFPTWTKERGLDNFRIFCMGYLGEVHIRCVILTDLLSVDRMEEALSTYRTQTFFPFNELLDFQWI